jgi:galactitol-specific phosphotransferase system IIB component
MQLLHQNNIDPDDEQEKFDKLIKSCRSKYIRTSQEIVDKVFKEQPVFLQNIKKQTICQNHLQNYLKIA